MSGNLWVSLFRFNAFGVLLLPKDLSDCYLDGNDVFEIFKLVLNSCCLSTELLMLLLSSLFLSSELLMTLLISFSLSSVVNGDLDVLVEVFSETSLTDCN